MFRVIAVFVWLIDLCVIGVACRALPRMWHGPTWMPNHDPLWFKLSSVGFMACLAVIIVAGIAAIGWSAWTEEGE